MGAPYRIAHDWSVPADRDAPLLIDGDGAPVAWGTYESVCAALNAAHAAGAAEERANLDSQLSAERARADEYKREWELACERDRASFARAEAAERRLVEARRALADIASDGGQSGGCLSERAEKALDALRPASAKPTDEQPLPSKYDPLYPERDGEYGCGNHLPASAKPAPAAEKCECPDGLPCIWCGKSAPDKIRKPTQAELEEMNT